MRRRRVSWLLAAVMVLTVGGFSIQAVVEACHCERKFNRFRGLWPGSPLRFCRGLVNMARKHGDARAQGKINGANPAPGPSLQSAPPFPSVDECRMMVDEANQGGNGGGGTSTTGTFGRARLTTSGGSGEIGETKTVFVGFIPQDESATLIWDITVTADPGNPAGFTIQNPNHVVGPGVDAYECVTLEVDIDLGNELTRGDIGIFTATATRRDTSDTVDDTFSTFTVVAVDGSQADLLAIVICPDTPLVKAGAGGSPMQSVTLTNTSPNEIDLDGTICPPVDGLSTGEYCDETPFLIYDFTLVSTTGFEGPLTGNTGRINIGGNETVTITATFGSRTFCELGMIGCCKFRFQDAPAVLSGDETTIIDSSQYIVNTTPISDGSGNFCPIEIGGQALEDGTISVGSGPISTTVPINIGDTAKDVLDRMARNFNANRDFVLDNGGFGAVGTHNALLGFSQGLDPAVPDGYSVDISGAGANDVFLEVRNSQGDLEQPNGIWIGKSGILFDVAITDLQIIEVTPTQLAFGNETFDADVTIDFTVDPSTVTSIFPAPLPEFGRLRLSHPTRDGQGTQFQEQCVDLRGIRNAFSPPIDLLTQVNCPDVPGFTVREVAGRCVYTATFSFPALNIAPGTQITVQIDPFLVISITNPAGRQNAQVQQAAPGGPPPAAGGGGGGFCGAGAPLAVIVILLLRPFLFMRRREGGRGK